MKIEFVDKLSAADEEKMSRDLAAYETEHGVDVNYRRFSLLLKDKGGVLIGAMNAYTAYSEVYIDDLWIDAHYRGQGYGKKLMAALEAHFQGKGFNNINLVTSAFQAPGFYKKCGFQVEFIRENKKNPQLTKTFFIKYFDDEVQKQGLKK